MEHLITCLYKNTKLHWNFINRDSNCLPSSVEMARQPRKHFYFATADEKYPFDSSVRVLRQSVSKWTGWRTPEIDCASHSTTSWYRYSWISCARFSISRETWILQEMVPIDVALGEIDKSDYKVKIQFKVHLWWIMWVLMNLYLYLFYLLA